MVHTICCIRLNSSVGVFRNLSKFSRSIRPVAKGVLAPPSEERYMHVQDNTKTMTNSDLRSVRKYSVHLGYQRGQTEVVKHINFLSNTLFSVNRPVGIMEAHDCEEPHAPVCLDESYIHQQYRRYEDNLFDPYDE